MVLMFYFDSGIHREWYTG